jgi:hypothetical protein
MDAAGLRSKTRRQLERLLDELYSRESTPECRKERELVNDEIIRRRSGIGRDTFAWIYDHIIVELKSMGPTKQGLFIIIVSALLFFSMLSLNGNTPWTYSSPSYLGPWEGLIGMGLNMASWSIISFIGIAIGLVRILVFNGKKPK